MTFCDVYFNYMEICSVRNVYIFSIIHWVLLEIYKNPLMAQSAGAAEYTDCFSAEG